MARLPPRSERWAWSARAKVLVGDNADAHLAHLIDGAGAFQWAAFNERSVDGERVTVRLLIDALDLPGAFGRTVAFFGREWSEPGERMVAMECG